MNPLRLLPLAALLVACPDPTSDPTDEPIDTAVCTEPTPVPCEDALYLDLGLQDFVAEGAVSTTADGDVFLTSVDASAGGFGNSANNPWVYVRFTPDGAEKVEIDDEAALTSLDWDMAFKRFIVRLNSGSSGPSCVGAAPFLSRTFDELTEVPAGTRFVEDDYYTADCTIINDSSGLPNSPQVAMGPWWEYPGCVATTGVPFLVQKADGSVFKLEVLSYYESNQEVCNTQNSPGVGSARLSMRWQFL